MAPLEAMLAFWIEKGESQGVGTSCEGLIGYRLSGLKGMIGRRGRREIRIRKFLRATFATQEGKVS